MRAIRKGVGPEELARFRAQPGAVYDGGGFTPVKDRIREQLLVEQGRLCAYCMQRIAADSMKVEHWRCRKNYPDGQLDYGNLLGCCSGNEGARGKEQHCDSKKGDDDIIFNPADPNHHPRLRIRYFGDGTIVSDDDRFKAEIEEILNLNWSRLRENRKKVLDAVIGALGRDHGPRTRAEIRRLIKKWNSTDAEGRLREYCDVVIYYLSKKLKAL
ncbi:MAG: retron system putative HNH endonuclease [Pseudomonadota bacterium]